MIMRSPKPGYLRLSQKRNVVQITLAIIGLCNLKRLTSSNPLFSSRELGIRRHLQEASTAANSPSKSKMPIWSTIFRAHIQYQLNFGQDVEGCSQPQRGARHVAR